MTLRNLHLHIYKEFRKKSIILLSEWKDLVMKMADFRHHRRFTLRYLKSGVTPFSPRLTNVIITQRDLKITRRAKR